MTVGTSKLQVANYFGPAVELSPQDWYTPGNASPAVSTSGYYNMCGLLYFNCYDISAMGTTGATIAASRGRYFWMCSAEHPGGTTYESQDSCGFKAGFSNDPGILPDTLQDVIPRTNVTDGTGLVGFTVAGAFPRSDMFHCLVYNPEDSGGKVFYIYVQTVPGDPANDRGTQGGCWKSSDLLTWTFVGLTHSTQEPTGLAANDGTPGFPNDNITSYQWVVRLSSGNWISLGVGGVISRLGMLKWSSTSGGGPFTFPTTVYNVTGTGITSPTANFSIDQTGSTNRFRLTSSSSVWSSGDTGKVLSIYDSAGALIKGSSAYTVFSTISPTGNKITFVSATEVTLTLDNDLVSVANNIPVEFGPACDRYSTSVIGGGSIVWFGTNIGADPIDIGGTKYLLSLEDARYAASNNQGQFITLQAVDSNYNCTGSYMRLSSAFAGAFPGPTYVQNVTGYLEDSILHMYLERGFPSSHTTSSPNLPYLNGNFTGSISGTTLTITALPAGIPMFIGAQLSAYTGLVTGPHGEYPQVIAQLTGTPGGTGMYTIIKYGSETLAAGSTINVGGGGGSMVEQFLDYYTFPIDLTAAALAAPFGVRVSCTDAVVTITWMEAFTSAQTYRVKRSTSSSMTSPTIIGTSAGTSMTDGPGAGFYYYQVIKMNSGVEGKYRIVSTYVS